MPWVVDGESIMDGLQQWVGAHATELERGSGISFFAVFVDCFTYSFCALCSVLDIVRSLVLVHFPQQQSGELHSFIVSD